MEQMTRAERSERIPLSFRQQGLWFLLQKGEGVGQAYHSSIGMRLQGALNCAALRRGLDRVLQRHEALRTTVELVEGEPLLKVIAADESRFRLIEDDVRHHSDGQGELDRLILEEARTHFDLEAGPLIRGRLIRVAEDEHVLLITTQHLVSDDWSTGVLIQELGTLYNAFVRGESDPLPELSLQYADYAAWQRKWMEDEILREQAEYWQVTLEGAPELLELRADHARPAQQEFGGDRVGLVLEAELTSGLRALSKQHGTTMYMTLLAGWAALLGRLARQQDVVIGMPVTNRSGLEIEKLIGLFANTLALRLDVGGAPTVGELLVRVKTQVLAAQSHQDIPFEQVTEMVRPVGSLAHSPLFQVTFDWQTAPVVQLELAGLEPRPLRKVALAPSKFDLSLSLHEAGERISGELEYATSLFERTTIERYLGYFRRLLDGMVADDSEIVDRLPILPDSERQKVLYEWNRTEAEYHKDKCVHELFEDQVRRSPEAVAVVFEDATLSYEELNRRANRVAHYLRGLGVKPDALVAICAERGFEMIIGLLGVLKAGAAYVPLDPAYPVERLRYMLQDSAPVALLTQGPLDELFGDVREELPVINLSESTAWQEQPETDPDRASVGLRPEHLAYLIYTSGSTGAPKGVMVEHQNVVRLFTATDAWFQFSGNDVWSLFHSYAFDFSVWEMWGALLYGGRLILIPQNVARSPENFYSLLCRQKVTILNQTPSAFRQLVAAQYESQEKHHLRKVIFGGEALAVATLEPWYEQNNGHLTELVNMYGITETTVHVTYRPLERADTERLGGSPIGRHIPDLRIYILDSQQQPVPIGVAGELYIGGAGVARGYWNRPELTAERFLPDPFLAGARIYRTGDLGRWLADGNIEFVGRNDSQVKIRGFRIELGEIEALLREHEGVREAVVVAREDTSGDKRLIAYYTSADTDDDGVRAEPLRTHLSAKLPDYMVPTAYVRLESLPLTPNGKLDRKALPAPSGARPELGQPLVAPRTELEHRLTQMWCKILMLDQVGVNDRFFELGGDSLRAATFVNSLQKQLGEFIYTVTIFEAPTLAQYASFLQRDYKSAVARWLGTSGGSAPEAAGGEDNRARGNRAGLAAIQELQRAIPLLHWSPEDTRRETEKNQRMIFILGPPRSGTSLVRVMLAGHPGLFSATELQLLCFNTLAERTAAFSGRLSAWLEGTLRAIMDLKRCGPEEAKRIMRSYEERKYTTKDFYAVLQEWAGDRILVDKSPHYALDHRALRKAENDFHNAFYVHIVRHPYAMVRSFEKQHMEQVLYLKENDLSPRQLGEAIWTLSHRNIVDFLSEVPKERQFRIGFEHLTYQPREVLTGLCDALGLKFHPDLLEPYKELEKKMVDGLYGASQAMTDQNFLIHRVINPEVADRWKEVSQDDFLSDVTWEMAIALGYQGRKIPPTKEYGNERIERGTVAKERSKGRRERRERRAEARG